MTFGLDYSDARPSHAAMKTAGVQFVCRYIGSQVRKAGRDAKWLSPAEAKSLHANGFDVVVVFEFEANRAEGGAAAGTADAHTAVAELAYCGLPADLPVYFAVDYDTTVGPHITAYFTAVAKVIGLKRTGAYGGFKVIKALFDKGLISYGWQTYAWSGQDWDPRNHIEQYSNDHFIGGESVDFDRSMKPDFGQWPASGQPSQEEDVYGGLIPAGKGQQVNISFPRGHLGAVGFFIDNTASISGVIEPQPQAHLRLALHSYTGGWQIEDVIVGRGPSDDKTVKKVVTFKNKANVDAATVVRLDDGTTPVGWDMS